VCGAEINKEKAKAIIAVEYSKRDLAGSTIMKPLIIIIIALTLAGCTSVSTIIPIGLDVFTVGSTMGGQFWTFGPSWPEVKALSLVQSNKFCNERGQYMEVIRWETHGVRGWTTLNAELTFRCLTKGVRND
jgi:hypothetical protein